MTGFEKAEQGTTDQQRRVTPGQAGRKPDRGPGDQDGGVEQTDRNPVGQDAEK